MIDPLNATLLSLLAIIIGMLAVLLRRNSSPRLDALLVRFDSLEKSHERTERLLREEMAQSRAEASTQSQQARTEMDQKLGAFSTAFQTQIGEISGLQKNQLDSFARQLTTLTQSNADALKNFNDSVLKVMGEMSAGQKDQLEKFTTQLGKLTESIEIRLEALRNAVDGKLKSIQEDNAKQLEQMRATVDEKLQGTLEKRLGESFKQVSERLEQVHKGLGEMQSLATGVGDLKRVLTNVKTRGGWGEIQLEALLEQMLSPDQYERNVQTKESSGEVVEFAVKLPGRGPAGDVVWLPIDAKFPIEDYHRLVEAQDRADGEAAEEAVKMLANRIKACARDIAEKYLNPPQTTDFGIMFLPAEGLFAEVLRRTGLAESIQREYRVTIAGPTTLAALLNSLQMGFRTVAIEQRSGEIQKLLGAVKNEFGKFGDLLDGVKRKLDQASSTMDEAARKSRTIERRLRDVQALPATETQTLLAENNAPTGMEEASP